MKDFKKGFSIERIYYNLPAYDKYNLRSSTAKDSATPGYVNACSPLQYDLKLSAVRESQDSFNIELINEGMELITGAELSIFWDTSKNIYFEEFEVVKKFSINTNNKISAYSISKNEINYNNSLSGFRRLKFQIAGKVDLDSSDNSLILSAFFDNPNDSIYFNEICYDVDETRSEFIELFNASDNNIDLSAWRIIDDSNPNNIDTIFINPDKMLYAKSYFIIAADSNIFNNIDANSSDNQIQILNKKYFINNEGDAFSISSPSGKIYDSCEFTYKMQDNTLFPIKNRSLERMIEDNSWRSCLDISLSTPLKANSRENMNIAAKCKITPNPLSKIKHKSCECFIKSPYPSAYFSLKLLDQNGALISKIFNLVSVGASDSIDIYDFLKYLDVGVYILKFEFTSTINGDYRQELVLLGIAE
jgi:hypothetical protein